MLLAVAMLLTMMPVSALAADAEYTGACGDDLKWTLDGEMEY